jgi:hypothetical protein
MNKDVRTYKDRKAYIIEAVAKRRKRIRLKAIEALGGKCIICGYNKYPEVLEFHHRDPAQKEFSISRKGHCRSWERIIKKFRNVICYVQIAIERFMQRWIS